MKYRLNLVLAEGDDEEAVIPDGVIEIGDSAFRARRLLRRVSIPDGCTKIGKGAFQDCSALREVILPESVSAIGEQCFKNCSELERVVLSPRMTMIPPEAFAGCKGLVRVEGCAAVETVGQEALENCAALESIDAPALKSVGNRAFANCARLRGVSFGRMLSLVGEMAFRNCDSLRDVAFPDSVMMLRDNAFSGCSKLVVDNRKLVRRFPNAFPREIAEAAGTIRKLDERDLAQRFREAHAHDAEELQQRKDALLARHARLERELPTFGVLDLKKRDAIVTALEDIEAEIPEIDVLLAEIERPSWETLVAEFATPE